MEFTVDPPAELIAALGLLPPNAIRARVLLTVLALNPGVIHGPAELLAGIRIIDEHARSVQTTTLHATLRNTISQLAEQGLIIPIRKKPLGIQVLNGNGQFKRLGWVWESYED